MGLTSRSSGPLAGGAHAPSARGRLASSVSPHAMTPSSRIAATLIASVFLGVLVAFGGLYAFGVAIGTLPTPPRWITSHPSIYIPALRVLVWLPLVVLCAFLVARLARSRAIGFGVIAGVGGFVALLAQLRASEYANGLSLPALASTYWVEVALLVAVLPLLCALWRPRVG